MKAATLGRASGLVAAWWLMSACTPTVVVQPPSGPIEINMNIKIEHEIRIKVDKELDAMFEDEDLF